MVKNASCNYTDCSWGKIPQAQCLTGSAVPGGPERWRVIAVACGGRHTMALALPDNGEVNNREVDRQRRLTSDSGSHGGLDIDDEEDELEGELQNGEFDEEEPGMAHSHICSLNTHAETEVSAH